MELIAGSVDGLHLYKNNGWLKIKNKDQFIAIGPGVRENEFRLFFEMLSAQVGVVPVKAAVVTPPDDRAAALAAIAARKKGKKK